jgi:hypothetical protein
MYEILTKNNMAVKFGNKNFPYITRHLLHCHVEIY